MNLQTPIGKLITLSYEEPDILGDPALVSKLSEFVKSIRNKTVLRGIIETSESAKNELYQIKMELAFYLINQPDIARIFENKILEQIGNFYAVKGLHQGLAQVTSDSLEVYYKIISQFPSDVFSQVSTINSGNKQEFPSFDSLKTSLFCLPFREMQLLAVWLESSLEFDYSLIISDLLIEEEMTLSASEENRLREFMREAIINFAGSAAAARLWTISSDNIPFLEEIKIRTVELSNNVLPVNKKISAGDFSGVWSKEDAATIEKVIQEGTEQIDEDEWT